MVRAVENWFDVLGRVEDLWDDSDRADYVVVALRVVEVDPVPGHPDLFAEGVGALVHLHVAAPVATQAGVQPGVTVRCRARMSRPGLAFAHPDRFEVVRD